MSSFVIDDYRLDITPQGNYPVVYLSQFEDGRDIRFYMLNRGRSFTIPTGISAFVSGLKSNGGYYEHLCTIDDNYVIMPVEADMTDASGRGVANIKLTNQSGDTVISAKFVVNVQESVSDSGIEVPTVAETIFQQLLDEIRQQSATISVNVTQLNNNVTQFIADINNEVDTFESGVDSDITALDARMNTFIAQHSGVSANATRMTETTLWSGKVYTSGGMIYASRPVTDYDYIDVYYNFAGNSAIQRFTPDVLIGSGGGTIRSANLTNGEAADNMPLAVFEIGIHTIADDGTETQNFIIDFVHWTWNGQPQSASVQTLGGNVNARYVYKLVGVKYDAVTASKDTELTDIRVSADGTVYTTAGAAVRALENRVDDQSIEISGTTLYIGGSV